MASKLGIIIGREYTERVRKKSFLITTILMPLLMVALSSMPALVMMFSEHDTTTLAVIDRTGVIGQQLDDEEATKFVLVNVAVDSAMKMDNVDGVLDIPASVLRSNGTIRLYTHDASSMTLESDIRHQINSIIENERLKKYDISNLDEILKDVNSDVTIQNFRIGNALNEDDVEQSSTLVSFIIAYGLTFLLYMCILIYGQMVMTSIIEEKTNRVLELVVSSVKPTQLMFGKIAGIGLVAVTQIVIWGVLITLFSIFVLPFMIPAEVMGDVNALNAGTLDVSTMKSDIDMVQAIAMLSNVGFMVSIFLWLFVFLVGGFLLYASISAAIGASVDNIQDTSQLQWISTVPIILGMIFSMMAAQEPNNPVAIWTSFIPFTSPMVMMARLPFGIPTWQVAISAVLVYLTFLATVWCAAKIYRVGIFMYGKKPTIKDLIRWVQYK
ncbi:MAG: ABC transporter permease [Barnesiella sp.]|nr:ABC transporter permease [Barnesiella sp.]